MRLSPAAELAVRGVLVLAEQQAQGPVTLATICRHRKLPKQYLTKIFGTLARAGLVIPLRGKRGGYMLARPLEKVTILEVIEAVEGPIALNYCQHVPPQCNEPGCRLRDVWTDLQNYIRCKLGAVTLADCVRRGPGSNR